MIEQNEVIPSARSGVGAFLLVKIFIALGLLWFLAARYDLGEALATLRNADFTLSGAAVAILLLGQLCSIWRWKLILGAMSIPLPMAQVIRVSFIGLFFNSTLPSVVGGDAVRVWELVRRGYPAWATLGSIIADRASGVIGLIVLVALAQPLLLAMVPSSFVLTVSIGALGCVALIGLALLLVERLPLPRLGTAGKAFGVLRSLRAVVFSPRIGVAIAILSVLGQASAALAVFALARALGIDVGLSACLALIPLVVLATLLPVTIGGWGIREGAVVAAMSLISLPPQQSLALSVAFGLALVVLGLPGGVFWLLPPQKGD